ncbi:unnamed protein product [Ambrosiozyma monospora]|uniref:Unnamed protein product n=1 Tax=Ambrosiozyma monospora TaxID=43982 RepID=A0A9W6Z5J9_AMBMO|nr:unnamed protein product [Ambrosiozyma monospora]
MSDFAKSFFSFAKQKSNTTTSQQQSDVNENLSLNLSPVTSNATTRSNGLSSGFPTDIIPHTATPTIALSENSFAKGTTLNRPITLQQQTSNLTAQLTNNNHKSGFSDSSSTYSNTTATLITNGNVNGKAKLPQQPSQENVNIAVPVNAEVDTAIPRGKLRVTIVEAVGLNVESSNSVPYVVCTFESSEAVSQAPESYDNDNHNNSRSNSNNSQFSRATGTGTGRRPLIRTQTSSHGRHHHNSANTNNNNNNNTQSNNNNNHSQNNNINFNTLNSNNINNKQFSDTQSSDSNSSGNSNRSDSHNSKLSVKASNPVWHYKSIFDVVGAKSELDISIYDSASSLLEADFFLGHIRIMPQTIEESRSEMWYHLKPRVSSESVTGKIKVKLEYSHTRKRHYGPDDFEILKMLGKGTFGRVFQVKKFDTGRVYAMKVLSKKLIWNKKEVAHTLGERNILARSTDSPFIVGLKFSFQTLSDLYLVTDYMSGGEMFFQLQKAGRFSEPRAKFYIAELILALEHLHDNDVVYRDLKPENILLDANGHIALCDFGLSKADLKPKDTTNTFCGTTEYLAPEVLLDETGYTKMVDFWSLGVLIFEMCCGWSPFYADNTQQMGS